MTVSKSHILVIKLGALGDFIQALGPMKAIRSHHPDAQITLLTTRPYVTFGQACGYFDNIWVDERPKLTDIKGWLSLRKQLRSGGFSRVYDLQNNDRTSLYFRLFFPGPKPEWVGTAFGASHRNTSPKRTAGLAFDGHVQTLGLAGIDNVEIDDLGWVSSDTERFGLKKPYILFVPGSAPQHPQKRWPAASYGALAKIVRARGFQPVILGTGADADAAQLIKTVCPEAQNLAGQTSLFDIVVLARYAAAAVGNDTGPMHIIAPTGCPSWVLFSAASNPVRHAPQGRRVTCLQQEMLEDLPVSLLEDQLATVWKNLESKYHTGF